MKKYIILLIVALFCSLVVVAYVQLKKMGITNLSLSNKNKSIQKGDSVTVTTRVKWTKETMKIKFSNKGPIQKGDSVTVLVGWDTLKISTIIFEDVYTPTREEVKNGKYTLVVRPEKNTTYQMTRVYTEGKPSTIPYEIKVLDENGVEIKED